MRVEYKAKAVDQLEELSLALRGRITDKIDFYASQSDPLSFAKPLAGYNAYRFRIGDYLAIVETSGDTLFVLLIVKREGAYRNL
jgi:mRNA-degrading endonuclease RelE of RelBE toxin-antitoxin system